jgi:hypothetical protein
MKLFACETCSNVVYFENTTCENCGSRLGYDPASNQMRASRIEDGDPDGTEAQQSPVKYCANAGYDACNWLVEPNSSDTFCAACRHNRTIPDLSDDLNLGRWQKLELAKHHLFYGLLRLRLPVETRQENPEFGLAFDILVDGPDGAVLTGHQDGVITLNLAEADDAIREQRRTEFGEPYRTLLGHFRHEIGHYYWDVLIQNSNYLQKFRQLFGDEQIDYAEALKIYYKNGAPANWSENFISPYATSHPWEDWAETWAHYLHMMDTLETAYNFGVDINPIKANHKEVPDDDISKDPYTVINFGNIIKMWLPLTFAVNSLNRSMGYADFYPFIISPTITEKLRFIHEVCGKARWGNL